MDYSRSYDRKVHAPFEEALEAATVGDMAPFHALLAAVRDPYGPEAGREGYVLPPPEGWAPYVTFCGT